MEKWLMGCGAAISGYFRVFDDGDTIAVVYYFRDCTSFARSAQAHDVPVLLQEARQGGGYVRGEAETR
jgi:hypothetical protein